MTRNTVSELLAEIRAGDRSALERLMPLVYAELTEMARQRRWHSAPGELGTTSLVHETFLKMADGTEVDWQSRAHFFYMASLAMRNVLTDNARRRRRQKRGGGARDVSLTGADLVSDARTEEILAIDEALERLERRDSTLARIVECRFFGGLTVEETAEALDVSPATVKRGWSAARAILFRDLEVSDRVS